MQKILLGVFIMSSCCMGWAERCPTIEALHHNQLSEWQVFNADNGTLLSPERLLKYEKKVKYFAEANYYEDAPEGPAQCYYDGEGEHYHLNTYLARYNLKPDIKSGEWQEFQKGSFTCRHSLEHCEFVAG